MSKRQTVREEEGGPLYYKDVLTRFYLEFFYPRDPTNECDRTIGSFSHQSGITREQLSLPLASPPSPSAFVASYGSSRVSTSGESASHLMTP